MRSISVLIMAGLLTACASSQPKTASTQPAASQPAASQPAASQPAATVPAAAEVPSNTKIVKSMDGGFEGQIVDNIKPDSRFAKLKIGMKMAEVTALIKAPDDMSRRETGKRWIPFCYGPVGQWVQVYYAGEGCLTYTGGNVFGGAGNQLIRITADPTRACFS